ncbi:MAG: triple tyrosine motif-containing protein, partial [Saprospiraceae bacterium]|nr:triple tyrosine motif-containing protein [Saprospiraceae bacterium]
AIEPIYYKRELEVNGYRSPHLFTKDDFWFGFRDGGIKRFNLTTKTWQDYKYDKDNSNSISSEIIYFLQKDPHYPDSLIWIGTGNGINVLTIATDEISVINTKDGLPNNVINFIQADHRKNFWITTNNGMAFMDYQTRRIHSFAQSDGLQHNEFNVGVGTKSDDGLLYFGGMGGLTYFDPEEFYADSTASNVVVTAFKTYNNPILFKRNVDSSKDPTILKKPLSEKQTIDIPYTTKMFSFEFSTLDLTDPEKNEYRYQLSGFDKNWIHLGKKNEATFTNLAPGQYKLNVQGKNYKGIWSPINQNIRIHVLTPWWLSYWFRAFVVLLMLAAIWALYTYRQKQKEKIQGLRNRISKDLHDEIGSTLSSISLYSTVVQHKIKDPQNEIKSILQKINESSTSVMESINDIVWAISSSDETFRDIINRLRSFTSDLISIDRVVEYEVEPKLLDRSVNMIVKRNIYMIIKEAINNANKYSQASRIQVTIKEVMDSIELCIIDNGVGFELSESESKTSLGGNGLRNMESRISEIGGKLSIHTSPGNGTSIRVLFKLTSTN